MACFGLAMGREKMRLTIQSMLNILKWKMRESVARLNETWNEVLWKDLESKGPQNCVGWQAAIS